MTQSHPINPFFAARRHRMPRAPIPNQTRYARLPVAPLNASPVPHLTSLYHFHRAGEYGDRSYPGNCGGNLIKDLLRFFRVQSDFDPLCCGQHKGSSVALFVMWR
jgi:hypothetical protein